MDSKNTFKNQFTDVLNYKEKNGDYPLPTNDGVGMYRHKDDVFNPLYPVTMLFNMYSSNIKYVWWRNYVVDEYVKLNAPEEVGFKHYKKLGNIDGPLLPVINDIKTVFERISFKLHKHAITELYKDQQNGYNTSFTEDDSKEAWKFYELLNDLLIRTNLQMYKDDANRFNEYLYDLASTDMRYLGQDTGLTKLEVLYYLLDYYESVFNLSDRKELNPTERNFAKIFISRIREAVQSDQPEKKIDNMVYTLGKVTSDTGRIRLQYPIKYKQTQPSYIQYLIKQKVEQNNITTYLTNKQNDFDNM